MKRKRHTPQEIIRVPEDISIVRFDDIPGAAFANPGLTTVRQPLLRMRQIAAQTVVNLIEGNGEYVPEIAIEPEFVVRESTGPAPSRIRRSLCRPVALPPIRPAD